MLRNAPTLRHRLRPWALAACASILLLVAPTRPAKSEARWLPETIPAPTLLADPYEPRLALAVFPADEHLHAALGGLVPLAGVTTEDGLQVTAALDGGAWLELGILGNLFPLETVDGAFGLRIDAARELLCLTLRARHWSAHRADGDSGVAYPPRSVSREFVTLEAGLHPGAFYVYARAGAAWHSIPESDGAMTAAGLQWTASTGAWRPAWALHWEHDPARGDPPIWSAFLGVETGHRPLRLGLRWWKGSGPGGQNFDRRMDRVGVELMLAPLSR